MNGHRGQSGIAALGPGAGRVLPWANHPSDPILDLALCGKRVYAAMGGPGGHRPSPTGSAGAAAGTT